MSQIHFSSIHRKSYTHCFWLLLRTDQHQRTIHFFLLMPYFQQFITRAIYSFLAFYVSQIHFSSIHRKSDTHCFGLLNPVFQQFIVRAIYSVTLLPLYVFQSIFVQFITKETCSVWFNCLGIKLSFI